jgi:hypothetical protein
VQNARRRCGRPTWGSGTSTCPPHPAGLAGPACGTIEENA